MKNVLHADDSVLKEKEKNLSVRNPILGAPSYTGFFSLAAVAAVLYGSWIDLIQSEELVLKTGRDSYICWETRKQVTITVGDFTPRVTDEFSLRFFVQRLQLVTVISR